MLENSMMHAVDQYVEAIKETETYKKYYKQLQLLKENPKLYAKVNEFRQKNFELQNTSQEDELFDKLEEFEQEYEKFREEPLVEAFLQAELAFCRMMQKLEIMVTEKLDFE